MVAQSDWIQFLPVTTYNYSVSPSCPFAYRCLYDAFLWVEIPLLHPVENQPCNVLYMALQLYVVMYYTRTAQWLEYSAANRKSRVRSYPFL